MIAQVPNDATVFANMTGLDMSGTWKRLLKGHTIPLTVMCLRLAGTEEPVAGVYCETLCEEPRVREGASGTQLCGDLSYDASYTRVEAACLYYPFSDLTLPCAPRSVFAFHKLGRREHVLSDRRTFSLLIFAAKRHSRAHVIKSSGLPKWIGAGVVQIKVVRNEISAQILISEASQSSAQSQSINHCFSAALSKDWNHCRLSATCSKRRDST